MTAPDAPKGRNRSADNAVVATSVGLALATGLGVGWFVGGIGSIMPAQHWQAPASPVVVQQAPFPPELIAAARADVARATELAPTPTHTPSPPTPSPTPDPMYFCGIDSVTGHVCRWPKAPEPTPTPFPDCATPDPEGLCIWRQP